MKDRRVEIYVDYEFLEKYFEHLNTADVLSEEFEVYYSFFKIIQQDHVRLISLESGKEIKATDVIRVYQSTFKFDEPVVEKYYIDKEFYSTAENPTPILYKICITGKNKAIFLFQIALIFFINFTKEN